jgi:hypothetical protein
VLGGLDDRADLARAGEALSIVVTAQAPDRAAWLTGMLLTDVSATPVLATIAVFGGARCAAERPARSR